MQGQRKIIEDILSSAQTAAQSMIAEATEEQSAALAELRVKLDEEAAAARKKSAELADSVYSGRVKLGDLEASKILLGAKQACIKAVYDGVRAKILGASDAEYLAILQKLIIDNCSDGDEIVAAQSDEKRVNAAFVKKVASAAGVTLKLAQERGDFMGGVILRNAKYDRDLTIDEFISDLKERTVIETAEKLGL